MRAPGRAVGKALGGVVAGPPAHPDQRDVRGATLRRLRRIEGQIRGLQRMVEGEAYCVDVLHQVAAVRAALAEVGGLLLGRHVERCVVDAVTSGSRRARERKLEELLVVLARLGRRG